MSQFALKVVERTATIAQILDCEKVSEVVVAERVKCGSAWKRDPGSGVIGVEKGPLIPLV